MRPPSDIGNWKRLDGSLLKHCLCHFHEAGDVGALDVVNLAVRLGTEFYALLVDALHDEVEFVINFLGIPADVLGVLGHLQTGSSHATGVDGLTGSEQDTVALEVVYGTGLATHVGDLAAAPATVGDEFFGVVLAQLILECARESDINGNAPCLLAGGELGLAGELDSHVFHLVAVGSTHFEHVVDHLGSDAVRNMADTVGAGDGNDFRTELGSLGGSAPGNVAETGQGDFLALDVLARLLEKVLGEIEGAETGSLRTEDGTAPGAALAGKDTGVVLAGQLLVHAIEVTDLTAAYSHVTCGDILVGTYAVPQLKHESLAETHDFLVGLAHRVEVGTTLCTAHGKGREGILEGLLEAEELEHGRCYGLVETQTALVGADSAVELDAVAQVGLNLTLVVNPSNPESEDAVGLDHPFDDLCLLELRMLVVNLLDGLENFLNSLKILLLKRILGLEFGHNFSCFHDCFKKKLGYESYFVCVCAACAA